MAAVLPIQFAPTQVFSTKGQGTHVFMVQQLIQLLPYARADNYGDRVSGLFRGYDQVIGVLQNSMNDSKDGFDLLQVPVVQNEFKDWVNTMMGQQLRGIGINAIPIFKDASN